MVQVTAWRGAESEERVKRKKLTSAYDIYQLLVGEIGRDRHEVLYDLQFWEINRIIRGYRRRGRLRDQLIAEAVFAAMHTMRDSKGKTVKDFFPMLFEDPDDDDREPAEITDEDMEMLRMEEAAYAQNLIADFNAHQAPAEPKPEQSESTTQ